MRHLLVLMLTLSWGCGDGDGGERTTGPDAPGWIANVEQPLPRWISQTGIYADLATQTPTEGLIHYEPQFPLYSNSSSKDRYLYLPEGTQIDTSDPDRWEFPVGAVLIKTFRYPDIEEREGQVQVETRVVFRREAGWDYAEYHWNVEGTQARLLEGNWTPQTLTLTPSLGEGFEYTLPARLDCRACHETHVGTPVIGVDRYTFDPELRGAGVFDRDPEVMELPARTPEEAAAMGYFVGNCVHCHHGEVGGDNASFSLRPEDLIENTINQETESSASGSGIRIVPGDPEGSAIFEAVVRARDEEYPGDFKPMPPAGIDRVDPDAARIFAAWIESL